MDWTHLRRLNLGISCPQYFFQDIGNCLRNLESLTMGIRTGQGDWLHWPYGPLICEDLSPVMRFIALIPGLRELCLLDMECAAQAVASVIVDSQKSLRKLSYIASMH